VDLQFVRPDKPPVIRGHHESLQQMLVNLLLNAIDAAVQPGGDGPKSQSTAGRPSGQVEVKLAGDDHKGAVLTVSDSGPGPAADVAEQLFEPLVTDKADGSGLGLTVAREMVELHGGSIRWERRDGATCFIVELPGTKPS
jgi:signal transduction histidine kinase